MVIKVKTGYSVICTRITFRWWVGLSLLEYAMREIWEVTATEILPGFNLTRYGCDINK